MSESVRDQARQKIVALIAEAYGEGARRGYSNGLAGDLADYICDHETQSEIDWIIGRVEEA